MSDRKALADAAVARMKEVWPMLSRSPLEQRVVSVMRKPPTLEIHWDDCDMDERTFWLHFRCPELYREVTGSGVARMISLAIRRCIDICDAELLEQSQYERLWWQRESPKASYYSVDGRKHFDRYETVTWIHTLTFYGG